MHPDHEGEGYPNTFATIGSSRRDGTECEVREAYTCPEGLVEHNSHILDARTKLFKDYADGHFMTFYGEPSQLLLDLLKAHAVDSSGSALCRVWNLSRRGFQALSARPCSRCGIRGWRDPMILDNADAKVRRFPRAEAHRCCRCVPQQESPPGRSFGLQPVEEHGTRCIPGESRTCRPSRAIAVIPISD